MLAALKVPDLPGFGPVLSTRDQCMLAMRIQAALDCATAQEMFLHPGEPAGTALVDHVGLWGAIRDQDQPWQVSDDRLRAVMALGLLVMAGGAGRLKTCAVPCCRRVFADPTNAMNRARCARHSRAHRIQ